MFNDYINRISMINYNQIDNGEYESWDIYIADGKMYTNEDIYLDSQKKDMRCYVNDKLYYENIQSNTEDKYYKVLYCSIEDKGRVDISSGVLTDSQRISYYYIYQ